MVFGLVGLQCTKTVQVIKHCRDILARANNIWRVWAVCMKYRLLWKWTVSMNVKCWSILVIIYLLYLSVTLHSCHCWQEVWEADCNSPILTVPTGYKFSPVWQYLNGHTIIMAIWSADNTDFFSTCGNQVSLFGKMLLPILIFFSFFFFPSFLFFKFCICWQGWHWQ